MSAIGQQLKGNSVLPAVVSDIKYASIVGEDINTITTFISAEENKRIVICDIVFSEITSGDTDLYDGDSMLYKLWPNNSGHTSMSINLTAPIVLSLGNALKIKSTTTDLSYSILITYYMS